MGDTYSFSGKEGYISKKGSYKGAEEVIADIVIGGTIFTFYFSWRKYFLSLLQVLRFGHPVCINSKN